MGRRSVGLAVTVAALTLAAAGCGSNRVESRSTTTVVPPTASSLPATSSPESPAPEGGGAPGGPYTTTPASVPPSPRPSLLTAVRAAGHDGFDRVVFEFADRVPGYQVGYVGRPVRQDGSGREITVAGNAVLQLRMVTASGVDLSASGARTTYTGPDRLKPPGTVVVEELVRTGDFEGYLTWVAGTSSQAPFHVYALDAPARLVIDVRP